MRRFEQTLCLFYVCFASMLSSRYKRCQFLCYVFDFLLKAWTPASTLWKSNSHTTCMDPFEFIVPEVSSPFSRTCCVSSTGSNWAKISGVCCTSFYCKYIRKAKGIILHWSVTKTQRDIQRIPRKSLWFREVMAVNLCEGETHHIR